MYSTVYKNHVFYCKHYIHMVVKHLFLALNNEYTEFIDIYLSAYIIVKIFYIIVKLYILPHTAC